MWRIVRGWTHCCRTPWKATVGLDDGGSGGGGDAVGWRRPRRGRHITSGPAPVGDHEREEGGGDPNPVGSGRDPGCRGQARRRQLPALLTAATRSDGRLPHRPLPRTLALTARHAWSARPRRRGACASVHNSLERTAASAPAAAQAGETALLAAVAMENDRGQEAVLAPAGDDGAAAAVMMSATMDDGDGDALGCDPRSTAPSRRSCPAQPRQPPRGGRWCWATSPCGRGPAAPPGPAPRAEQHVACALWTLRSGTWRCRRSARASWRRSHRRARRWRRQQRGSWSPACRGTRGRGRLGNRDRRHGGPRRAPLEQ